MRAYGSGGSTSGSVRHWAAIGDATVAMVVGAVDADAAVDNTVVAADTAAAAFAAIGIVGAVDIAADTAEAVTGGMAAAAVTVVAAGDLYHHAFRTRCRPGLLRYFDLPILRPALRDHHLGI